MIYIRLLVPLFLGRVHYPAGPTPIPVDDARARSLALVGHAVILDRCDLGDCSPAPSALAAATVAVSPRKSVKLSGKAPGRGSPPVAHS